MLTVTSCGTAITVGLENKLMASLVMYTQNIIPVTASELESSYISQYWYQLVCIYQELLLVNISS